MRFTLLAPMLLSACAALVPSTAMRLARISPLNADPAAIELALILPPGLAVPEGGAKMVIEAHRKATGETLRGDYVLAGAPGDAAPFDPPAGGTATLYRVAARDVAPMRALQAKVAAWQAAEPNGTNGTFSMGLAGCAVGAGPDDQAEGAVFIRTEAAGSFLPLIANTRIKSLIGPDLFDAIAPCTGQPR